MLRKIVMSVLMALLAAGAAAETVYKWMDSRGQVHFTDRPPRASDAKILGVYQQTTGLTDEDDAAGDAAGGPPTSPSPDPAVGAEPAVASSTVAAVQADVARARSENCKQAQERYKNYVESRRLYREKPGGEREYLSDQELTEARVRAKQAVDDFCG